MKEFFFEYFYNMNSVVKITLLFFLYSLISFSQEKIQWISFEKMEEFQKKENRPVIIDIYTDWCGWCKRLDATTYADPNLVNYVNKNFYAIKFNAETLDSIAFQNKIYRNFTVNGRRGTHELAVQLIGNRPSYPTTVFLNDKKQTTVVVPGFLDVNQMFPFLAYHSERLNENTNINDFTNDFKRAYFETPNDSMRINWLSLNKAVELQKNNPKKIFIHLKNHSFISDQVINKAAFQSKNVIELLNKEYYNVEIDVFSKDSIVFQDNLFVNPNQGNDFHQIAYGLTQNQLSFPCFVILNEQALVLAPIKQYTTEMHLVALLSYFKGDTYIKKSFADFIKENYNQ